MGNLNDLLFVEVLLTLDSFIHLRDFLWLDFLSYRTLLLLFFFVDGLVVGSVDDHKLHILIVHGRLSLAIGEKRGRKGSGVLL